MVVVTVLLRRYQMLRYRSWASATQVKLRAVQVKGSRAVPNVEV